MQNTSLRNNIYMVHTYARTRAHTHTHTHTHTHKPVSEHEGVTELWNQGVHTDRKVTANRPDILIKNKKEKTCVC
jgi:hypothetical protein